VDRDGDNTTMVDLMLNVGHSNKPSVKSLYQQDLAYADVVKNKNNLHKAESLLHLIIMFGIVMEVPASIERHTNNHL